MNNRWKACVLAAAMFVTTLSPVMQTKAGETKWTVENVKSRYAIEADVKLMGDGVGSHAKLVLVSPLSGVSFGIQYDKGARAPYTGRAMLIMENIKSNDPGGQRYYWPKDIEVDLGKFYHLMLALDEDGRTDVYLEHKKVATYYNKKLKNESGELEIRPRVEASAKYNGDVVDAVFKNIEVKDDVITVVDIFDAYRIDTCKDIKSRITSTGNVSIYGKLTGLTDDQDWDSAYEAVSGIVQFNYDDLADSDDDDDE